MSTSPFQMLEVDYYQHSFCVVARFSVRSLELKLRSAKLEGFFHGELTKIALSNKIDINNFVLDDNLEIKPKGPSPQQLRA